jgi:hypothetical protein
MLSKKFLITATTEGTKYWVRTYLANATILTEISLGEGWRGSSPKLMNSPPSPHSPYNAKDQLIPPSPLPNEYPRLIPDW